MNSISKPSAFLSSGTPGLPILIEPPFNPAEHITPFPTPNMDARLAQFVSRCLPGRSFDDTLALYIIDSDYAAINQLPNCITAFKNAYLDLHPEFDGNRDTNLFGACRFLTVLLQRAIHAGDPDPLVDYVITPILLLFPSQSIPFLLEPANLFGYLTMARAPDVSRQLRWLITYHFAEFVNQIFIPLIFYGIDRNQLFSANRLPTECLGDQIADTCVPVPNPSFAARITQTASFDELRQLILDHPSQTNFPTTLWPSDQLDDIGGDDVIPNGLLTDEDPLWARGSPRGAEPSDSADRRVARIHLAELKSLYLAYIVQADHDWRMVSIPPATNTNGSAPVPSNCSTCDSNSNIISNAFHPIPKASESVQLSQLYEEALLLANQSIERGEPHPQPPALFSTYPFPLNCPNSPTDPLTARPLDIFATFNIRRPEPDPVELKKWFSSISLALRLMPFFHPHFAGITPTRYQTILDFVLEWCHLMLQYCPDNGFLINALLNRVFEEFIRGHHGLLRSYGYDVLSLDVLTPQVFLLDQYQAIRRLAVRNHLNGGDLSLDPAHPSDGDWNNAAHDRRPRVNPGSHALPPHGLRTDADFPPIPPHRGPIPQPPLLHTRRPPDPLFQFGHWDDFFLWTNGLVLPHSTQSAATESFPAHRFVLILHHAIIPFVLSTPALFFTPSLLSSSITSCWNALKSLLSRLSVCPHPCTHCFDQEAFRISQQFPPLATPHLPHLNHHNVPDGGNNGGVDDTAPDGNDDDHQDGSDDEIILRPLSNFDLEAPPLSQVHLPPRCNHLPHAAYWKRIGDDYLTDLVTNASFWSFRYFPKLAAHAFDLEEASFVIQSSRRFAPLSTLSEITGEPIPAHCSRSLNGRVFRMAPSGSFIHQLNLGGDGTRPDSPKHSNLPVANRQRVVQAIFEVYATIQILNNPAVFRRHIEALVLDTFDHYFPPPARPPVTGTSSTTVLSNPTRPITRPHDLDDEKMDARGIVHLLLDSPATKPAPDLSSTPTATHSFASTPQDHVPPLPTFYQYLLAFLYCDNSKVLSSSILNFYLLLPFFALAPNPHAQPTTQAEGPSPLVKFLMVSSKLNLFNHQHPVAVNVVIANRFSYLSPTSPPLLNPIRTQLNAFNLLTSKTLSAILTYPDSPTPLLTIATPEHDEINQICSIVKPLLLAERPLASGAASPNPEPAPLIETSFYFTLANIDRLHSSPTQLRSFAINSFLASVLETAPLSHPSSPHPPSPKILPDSDSHWLEELQTADYETKIHHSRIRALPVINPEVAPTRKPSSRDFALLTIHPNTASQSSLLLLSTAISTRHAHQHPTTADTSWFPPYTKPSSTQQSLCHLPGKSRLTALSSRSIQLHHASLSTRHYSIYLASNLPAGHAVANNRMKHIAKSFASIGRYFLMQRRQQQQQQREAFEKQVLHQQELQLQLEAELFFEQTSDEEEDFEEVIEVVTIEPINYRTVISNINHNSPWTRRQLEDYANFLDLLNQVDDAAAVSIELYINCMCFVISHQHDPDFLVGASVGPESGQD